jgi:uncharacterized protein (DUF427 family)
VTMSGSGRTPRPGPAGRAVPGPGQESVWDYPRPPRVETSTRRVRVEFAGVEVADSIRAVRVLETAGAPCWYLPREDVRTDLLESANYRTFCEWKGSADHFDLVAGGRRSRRAAWSYPEPSPGYEAIAGFIAFYASRVDVATVDGERVTPQPGGYYGGWVTSDVVGPFKGEPGTEGW